MSIPVVDVSSVEESSVVQQIHDAFSTVGFVFITGHSIPRELVSYVGLIRHCVLFSVSRFRSCHSCPLQVDRACGEAAKFFTLPLESKLKYGRTPESKNNGYVSLELERYMYLLVNICSGPS